MTILWSITKLGKSVCRVIQDGSLASFGMSYKRGLVSVEFIQDQGLIIQF